MGQVLAFRRKEGESSQSAKGAQKKANPGAGKEPAVEQRVALIRRMQGINNDAEEYMSRVLARHFKGELTYNQAYAEIAKAKAISDSLVLMHIVLRHSRIGEHPVLLDSIFALGVDFSNRVEGEKMLPKWNHVPDKDHVTSIDRTQYMYEGTMRQLAQNMDSLVDLRVSLKDFCKVILDAQQMIRVAGEVLSDDGAKKGG